MTAIAERDGRVELRFRAKPHALLKALEAACEGEAFNRVWDWKVSYFHFRQGEDGHFQIVRTPRRVTRPGRPPSLVKSAGVALTGHVAADQGGSLLKAEFGYSDSWFWVYQVWPAVLLVLGVLIYLSFWVVGAIMLANIALFYVYRLFGGTDADSRERILLLLQNVKDAEQAPNRKRIH